MTSVTWSQTKLGRVVKGQGDRWGGLSFLPTPGKGMVELRVEGGKGGSWPLCSRITRRTEEDSRGRGLGVVTELCEKMGSAARGCFDHFKVLVFGEASLGRDPSGREL